MNDYNELSNGEKIFLVLTFLIITLTTFHFLALVPNDQRDPVDYRSKYQKMYHFCAAFEQSTQIYDCQRQKFEEIFPNEEQFNIWLELRVVEEIHEANGINIFVGGLISLVIGAILTVILFIAVLIVLVIIREGVIDPFQKNRLQKREKKKERAEKTTDIFKELQHTNINLKIIGNDIHCLENQNEQMRNDLNNNFNFLENRNNEMANEMEQIKKIMTRLESAYLEKDP